MLLQFELERVTALLQFISIYYYIKSLNRSTHKKWESIFKLWLTCWRLSHYLFCMLWWLLIATKSDAIRRYLKFLLDSFLYHWGHFLCYMSPDCLFNIQSKLSLVEIESEYRLIWITERTSKYSCAGAWNCIRNGEDHHLVSQSNSKTCVFWLAKGSQQIVYKRLNVLVIC